MNIKAIIKNAIPDYFFLKYLFKKNTGKTLNLKSPRTFNEKLQWLKLYDRNPLYTILVDKCAVKQYVLDKIGGQYIIPTIGVWKAFEDIDFDKLPCQFVLKCTHDSGGIVICKDKSLLNIDDARNKIAESLKQNFYYAFREWPYKNVPPRIIAEKYMEDESGELRDYKVMCFDGIPKLIEYHQGRFNSHTQDFYDENWNLLPMSQGTPLSGTKIGKPLFFEQMMKLSAILSGGIPHVRVDWYCVHNQLYFGEMTFYDASGFEEFEPEEYNRILGDWIKLPNL